LSAWVAWRMRPDRVPGGVLEDLINGAPEMAEKPNGRGPQKIGSPGRIRTSDPTVNSRLLYRLSYRGALSLQPEPSLLSSLTKQSKSRDAEHDKIALRFYFFCSPFSCASAIAVTVSAT
jgi:hypothetical protein